MRSSRWWLGLTLVSFFVSGCLSESDYQQINWRDKDGRSLLKDLEIDKNYAWVKKNVSGLDFTENIFFALFGDEGMPFIQSGQKIRKHNKRALRMPDETDEETKKGINPIFLFSLSYDDLNECIKVYTGDGSFLNANQDGSISLQRHPTILANSSTTELSTTVESKSACWNLYKYKKKFYVFESVDYQGLYIKSDFDGDLRLEEIGNRELFTGIYTNFVVDMELSVSSDYSSDEKLKEYSIKDGHYGDIVVRYYDTLGNIKKGFICDYEWETVDASKFCQFKWSEDGLPTYNGQYTSKPPNVTFAMSGVDCKIGESGDIMECPFRTACSTDSRSLCQKSMSLYDGKGFGCLKGNEPDIAGVICGDPDDIIEMKKDKLKCIEKRDGNFKKTVSRMYAIEEQAKEAGMALNQGKHWSEYLLPIPMTVSLISILSLVTAQFNTTIKFERPANGQWEYLKYDYFAPNLIKLQNIMTEAFETSDEAMLRINVNSKEMNFQLKKSVEYAALPQDTGPALRSKTMLLASSIKAVGQFAETNIQKSNATITQFERASKFIGELLEAMKKTEVLSTEEKNRLEIHRKRTEEQQKKDEGQRKEEERELKKLQKKEQKVRDELFENAEKAKSAQCVMEPRNGVECVAPGNEVCKDFVKQDGYQSKLCLKYSNTTRCENMVSNCTEWDTGICLEEEQVCLRNETFCPKRRKVCLEHGDGTCQQFKTDCEEWSGWAFDKKQWCGTNCGDHCGGASIWSNPCCKAEGGYGNEECVRKCKIPRQICEKRGEPSCLKWDDVCDVEEQQFCAETGTLCKSRSNQCKKTERVCEKWAKPDCLEYKIVPSGLVCQDPQYKGLCVSSCAGADRIGKTIGLVLQQSIALETRSIAGDLKTTELLDILTVTVQNMRNMTGNIAIQRNISQKVVIEGNVDVDLDVDMSEDLDMLIKTLPYQKRQLKTIAIRNKLAKPSKRLVNDFLSHVKEWTKDGKFARLSMGDTKIVYKFTEEIEHERENVKKAKNEEKVDISFDPNEVTTATLVTKSAEEYITTKSRRVKKANKVFLLSQRILDALEDLATTKLDINDYNQTIHYLIKCSDHLNKLKEAWGEIKDFFVSVRQMGIMIKHNSNIVKENKNILTQVDPVAHVSMIMTNIKEATVKAYSMNVYSIEVSAFYRKIMQRGLLKKIRGLHFEKCPEKNCVDNIRQHILAETTATQKYIGEQIRMDEARLSRRLRKDIYEINNHIACLIKENPAMMKDKGDFTIVDKLTDAQQNVNQTQTVIEKNEEFLRSPDLVTDEILLNNEVDTEEVNPYDNDVFDMFDSFVSDDDYHPYLEVSG